MHLEVCRALCSLKRVAAQHQKWDLLEELLNCHLLLIDQQTVQQQEEMLSEALESIIYYLHIVPRHTRLKQLMPVEAVDVG